MKYHVYVIQRHEDARLAIKGDLDRHFPRLSVSYHNAPTRELLEEIVLSKKKVLLIMGSHYDEGLDPLLFLSTAKKVRAERPSYAWNFSTMPIRDTDLFDKHVSKIELPDESASFPSLVSAVSDFVDEHASPVSKLLRKVLPWV